MTGQTGFFPGSLWYAYELTGNDTLKTQTIQYTNLLNLRYYKGTHDLGFMINCSYGNAERFHPNDTIAAVMKETADNLCGRFNDSIAASSVHGFPEHGISRLSSTT